MNIPLNAELPEGILLRRAVPDDASALQALEQRAASRFQAVGMPAVAEGAPLSQFQLKTAAAEGRILLLEEPTRRKIVGFILWRYVHGWLCIEELDIDPEWSGKRLGGHLMAHAERFAKDSHLAGLVLTTFRNVPWNAPYYLRLGFQEWTPDHGSPELMQLLDVESSKFKEPRCLLVLPQASILHLSRPRTVASKMSL